jgi:hypothetical protein
VQVRCRYVVDVELVGSVGVETSVVGRTMTDEHQESPGGDHGDHQQLRIDQYLSALRRPDATRSNDG